MTVTHARDPGAFEPKKRPNHVHDLSVFQSSFLPSPKIMANRLLIEINTGKVLDLLRRASQTEFKFPFRKHFVFEHCILERQEYFFVSGLFWIDFLFQKYPRAISPEQNLVFNLAQFCF